MAYDVRIWGADGKGEYEIKAIRIKAIAEIPEIVSRWVDNDECVRITKERTSGNITPFHTEWIRPGYTDPF